MPSRPALASFLRGAGCPEDKVVHCQDVANVASVMGQEIRTRGMSIDLITVETGALLHDIGIAFTIDDLSPEHCALGANFLRNNGFAEAIAKCVERHEMGGITRDEAEELGGFPQPLQSTYLPASLEEYVVAFADLMYFTVVEERRDPWSDPEAAAKALYVYADAVFRKKLGRPVERAYPVFARAHKLTEEFLPYLPRESFERWFRVDKPQ